MIEAKLSKLRLRHAFETVCIAGPGASLLAYGPKALRSIAQYTTIAISTAPLYLGVLRVDYFVACDDGEPALGNVRAVHAKWPEAQVVYCWPLDFDFIRFTNEADWEKWFEGVPQNKNGLCGQSSLMAAISLAAYMGASQINMVGIDLGEYKGKYYWDTFDSHAEPDAVMLTSQRRAMEQVADMLKKNGIILKQIMPKEDESLCRISLAATSSRSRPFVME